jgi:hypothetical protein
LVSLKMSSVNWLVSLKMASVNWLVSIKMSSVNWLVSLEMSSVNWLVSLPALTSHSKCTGCTCQPLLEHMCTHMHMWGVAHYNAYSYAHTLAATLPHLNTLSHSLQRVLSSSERPYPRLDRKASLSHTHTLSHIHTHICTRKGRAGQGRAGQTHINL